MIALRILINHILFREKNIKEKYHHILLFVSDVCMIYVLSAGSILNLCNFAASDEVRQIQIIKDGSHNWGGFAHIESLGHIS